MSKLENKKCLPCEGIGKTLEMEAAQAYLKDVLGWEISQDGKSISRTLRMKNFIAAIKLCNDIAKIAEDENHHPDLHLTGYRNLKIDLSTHALGGLTENDFILAVKINNLKLDLKK